MEPIKGGKSAFDALGSGMMADASGVSPQEAAKQAALKRLPELERALTKSKPSDRELYQNEIDKIKAMR
jgi:hypothetical protein